MRNNLGSRLTGVAALLALLHGCGAPDPVAAARGSASAPAATLSTATATASASASAGHCLPQPDGWLRAQLRGAINADLAWRDGDMTCEGGSRPDGRGIRVSIAGPLQDARTLRLVFGIDDSATAAGAGAVVLPTNVTAIVEGEQQLFATLGDDKCTTEQLRRTPTTQATVQRVDVRGFCTGPAASLDGQSRLLVTTFEFSARVVLEAAP